MTDQTLPSSEADAIALLMEAANTTQEITSRLTALCLASSPLAGQRHCRGTALAFQAVAHPEYIPVVQSLMEELLTVLDRHDTNGFLNASPLDGILQEASPIAKGSAEDTAMGDETAAVIPFPPAGDHG